MVDIDESVEESIKAISNIFSDMADNPDKWGTLITSAMRPLFSKNPDTDAKMEILQEKIATYNIF